MEFEALVPIGRWHGFGGHTNFQRPGLRMLLLGVGDRRLDQILRDFRDLACADHPSGDGGKQATTIDHVTGGRFALNIVTGWNRPEIEMFGSPLMEHNDRYDCAVEWLDIMKQLVDAGRAVRLRRAGSTRSRRAISNPKPIQRPFPAVMNAGWLRPRPALSPRSIATWSMSVFGSHDFRRLQGPRSTRTGSGAPGNTAARFQIWSYAYVGARGDTEKEARALYDDYVNRRGDWDAVDQSSRHHDRQRQDAAEGRCWPR
jgi:alkanesulfonate monooxygenase SsuD/methylene tetrahydromethanopterin reductase-like flavin-dependent oxidoreductase (luciferase family)